MSHRLIPLEAAIAEFDLEALFYRNGDFDTLEETFEGPYFVGRRNALVFDGDAQMDHYFGIWGNAAKRHGHVEGPVNALLEQVCIVVVNGDLQAPYVNTNGCRGLFVFGDVRCETFEFWEFDLAWIAGNLEASRAVLATASQDESFRVDWVGRSYACVQGEAFSPRVQSWFMHLGHLKWREGSGREFREDIEYADRDHLWKTDPIW